MVTVARSVDLPLKLKLPYWEEGEVKFSLLGLGDIVLPGLLLSLCFKFDIDCCIVGDNPPRSTSEFRFPLYYSTLLAYGVSLLVTIGVMVLSGHAQPALVFIVPLCSLAMIGRIWVGTPELSLW